MKNITESDTPLRVMVCGVMDVLPLLQKPEHNIVAVLSIENPTGALQGETAPRLHQVPQSILQFHDTSDPEQDQAPTYQHLEAGLAFVQQHIGLGTVLIHCQMGMSRSPAMALAVLANLVFPHKNEEDLVEVLQHIRPGAAPNALMVDLIDTMSGRNGRLTAAVDKHPLVQETRTIFPSHVAVPHLKK